jgi:ABC-type nitrate/sulfonate/bicarbonate transport system ATPase subunit
VHLAQLDAGQVLYVDKRNAAEPVEMYSQAGKVGPAYCTGVGKAMLAYLPEADLAPVLQRQAWHAFTPRRSPQPRPMHAELAAIRARGHAFDDEEHEPGIICVAVPIRTRAGRVLGAVSVTSTTARTDLAGLTGHSAGHRRAVSAIAIKRYGATQVIHGVDLEIEDGEFCVFVGPSGCGKSTLLRMVAGLEETTEGRIAIGGRDVTRLDPAERGVAMVFQTYALYPHMTVEENMGFGLKMTGHPKAEIKAKVAEASRILKLDDYLSQAQAPALSGGQRQRVAIGRAIVRGPEVFLFDEPLSNLDAELRVEMRVEIARLHKEIGATMIYVTHDQVEAMTLADKIVVLRAGASSRSARRSISTTPTTASWRASSARPR